MKLYLFIGLTILAVASARVVREAPKEQSFTDQIEAGLQDVQKLFQDLTSAANTDELQQKLDGHGKSLLEHLSAWTDKAKTEADKLKESEMVKELRRTIESSVKEVSENVDKQVAKFKEDQPETFNNIAHHVDAVKSTTSEIASKIEALAKSEDATRLKEQSLEFLDNIKNSLMTVLTEVKEGEKKD